MSLDHYVTLGRSGLRVSPFCLGAMTFAREHAADATPGRGERVKVFLNERTFTMVDELIRIAGEHDTTPAAVALAWVQAQPGVTSTIIGARTMPQLESNLAGIAVTLDSTQLESLDRVSVPTLNFPLPFLQAATTIMHSGATVDGAPSEVWPMSPATDDERHCGAHWPVPILAGPAA